MGAMMRALLIYLSVMSLLTPLVATYVVVAGRGSMVSDVLLTVIGISSILGWRITIILLEALRLRRK